MFQFWVILFILGPRFIQLISILYNLFQFWFILFILILDDILWLGTLYLMYMSALSLTCHGVTRVVYVQCMVYISVPLFIRSVVCAHLSYCSSHFAPSRTFCPTAITLLGIYGDKGDCDYNVWDSGDMAPSCEYQLTWIYGI